MLHKLQLAYPFLCLLLLFSCKEKKAGEEERSLQQLAPAPLAEVKTQVFKETVFHYDILSNGKLSVHRKVDLRFLNGNESITDIKVKNGDRVRKGQLLAEQDKFRLENTLKQNEIQLEQARLELQNILIGQAYSLEDSTKVPPKIMKIACIRSGYDNALVNYQLALYNFHAASIYAPFEGIVANLFTVSGNLPAQEVFCTILDNSQLTVDFTILENELGIIQTGDKVYIETFTAARKQAQGTIREINPFVESNGLVRVKAGIQNTEPNLFEGMNVKVKIRKELTKKLVIPKSALVLRDNKQVVFSYKDGKALWNYVHTELENSDSYTIRLAENSTLAIGDQLIIDGNINLAHETPVTLKNDE